MRRYKKSKLARRIKYIGVGVFALLVFLGTIVEAAPKKRARSATGGNISAKASRSASSSSSKKTATDKAKPSGSKKKKSSEAAPATAENPAQSCLADEASALKDGACSFLMDDALPESFKSKDFLCVFQSKASGKTSSVYEYYFQQNYGVSETSIKPTTADITVKYKKKGLKKYYDYLLERANSNRLAETDILDDITNQVLEKSNLDLDSQAIIENKEIDAVVLPSSITRSDIDKCSEAVKASLKQCGSAGDQAAKKQIADSCTAYESELMKLASASKSEALKKDEAIIAALTQRLSATVDNQKRANELAKEASAAKNDALAIDKQKQIDDLMNSRAAAVVKIVNMKKESSGYPTKMQEICDYDNKLASLKPSYIPDDSFGCGALATPPPPAAEPAIESTEEPAAAEE